MKRESYKVLHIFSGYGGGISSIILNLIENKTDNFIFDVMAFSFDNGELFIQRLKKMGTCCITMPRPRIDGYSKFIKFINDTFANEKYDAVHCHIAGWSALPFYRIARKNGVKKFIIHAHTTTYDRRLDRVRLINSFDKYVNFRMATEYMTCSDMAAEYIFGKTYLQKKRNTLIPNGIKEELFKEKLTEEEKAYYIKEFSIPCNSKVIGHVGRFNTQKNHEFILKIISRTIENNYNNYVFLLVGTGDKFEQIQQKARSMGISDKIRFLGRRNDISKLMQFMDCMILPSFYEGLPTVAIECQASGTPIILSDTITKQSDMGIGLAKFVSIEKEENWVAVLSRMCEKVDITRCLEIISNNNFTARKAGILYCNNLKRIITNGDG